MPYEKSKQPQEVLDYDIDCTRRLSSDDYITSVSVSNIEGPDTALIVERESVIEEGTRAKVWLSGGTNGQRYKITILCVTDMGRVIESEFFLSIKDK